MDLVTEFISFGGTFDQRYRGKEGVGNERFLTFKAALSLFLQNNRCINIVETGCQRQKDDWGAGCSSLIFAETISTFPHKGKLYGVDISLPNLHVCCECLSHIKQGFVTLTQDDSKHFLIGFKEPIGLLYLDSMDYEVYQQREAQQHQLDEIILVYDKLTPDTIILLDDNHFENGGKSKLTKEFLKTNGWFCVLDHHQSLWIKGR